MKTIWNRITLMHHATSDNNGQIPRSGWVGSVALGIAAWVGYSLLVALSRG